MSSKDQKPSTPENTSQGGMSTSKKLGFLFGGVAVASVGLLIYTLTRSSKEPKPVRTEPKKPKEPRFTHTFKSKPLDIHLVMFSEDGFGAHVAADKKNKEKGAKLRYGAQLVKINNMRVDKWPYEDVFRRLLTVKVPIKLEFREVKCETSCEIYEVYSLNVSPT